MRDPVILTLMIMSMLDKHEPDKTKQAELLTEHLAGHRILPFTEEELQQHMERKAKRELDIQIASMEAETLRHEQAKLATTAQHAQNTKGHRDLRETRQRGCDSRRSDPKDRGSKSSSGRIGSENRDCGRNDDARITTKAPRG